MNLTATHCPTCGQSTDSSPGPVPPEPPPGTWVRDRHGAVTMNQGEGWAPPGFYPFGKWEAMWAARGPLVECNEWGRP